MSTPIIRSNDLYTHCKEDIIEFFKVLRNKYSLFLFIYIL